MAVFTELNSQDVEALLASYEIGQAVSLEPIGAGIENTNYFLTTELNGARNKWVVTLFENLQCEELPYFCDLKKHLAEHGFSVPAPVLTEDGGYFFRARERTGVIVPCLPGKARVRVSSEDCRQLGQWMARMHCCLQSFNVSRPLVRNLEWMQTLRSDFVERLPDEQRQELDQAITRYSSWMPKLSSCPQGTVHGDLFRDNVLFESGSISGVIDFYNACDATLLYDLAIAANDWTVEDGQRQRQRIDALVEGYQSVRPWTQEETDCWHYLLELAALRFWISRLHSFYSEGYQSSAVSGQAIKNPDQMRQLMRLSQSEAS